MRQNPSAPLRQYLILADDLSGAADCAAGFAAAGWRTQVLLGTDDGSDQHAIPADVLTIDTDSRRESAEQSAAKLRSALMLHGAGRTVLKKIDSTLRGGWAAEVAALQSALGQMALVIPSFPAMGRTLVDGIVQVRGQRLADTDTWQLEHANQEDRPAQMLRNAGLHTENVALDVTTQGAPAVAQWMELARTRGVQALVFDVASDTDLQTLAQASIEARSAFCVCSAGLSHAIARQTQASRNAAINAQHASGQGGVITLVGSMSAVAREQLRFLAEQPEVRVHEVSPGLLRDNTSINDTELQSLQKTLQRQMAQGLDVVVCIGTDAAFDPAEGPQLATRLAQALGNAFKHATGMVLTGGETARAVLQQRGIHRLHVRTECEPGVVLSQSASASTPQWIATKAGAFGNAQSLHRAILAIHAKQQTPTEES